MAYSTTPFSQSSTPFHSNMYGLKSSGGMASMPYHMGGLGLGLSGMGSLDAMHPATMSYGAPCEYNQNIFMNIPDHGIMVLQLEERNSAVREPPSPDSSWISWRTCSRRLDILTSSCGKKWRSK